MQPFTVLSNGAGKVADIVGEVTGLLTADVELEQVLNRVLSELELTLPCDFVAIWLLAVIFNLPEFDEKKYTRLNLSRRSYFLAIKEP